MATTLRVGSGVFSTFRSIVAEPPLSPGCALSAGLPSIAAAVAEDTVSVSGPPP